MQLTPHFTLAEFVRSDKAVEHGIDNALPNVLLAEATRTAQLLERIRTYLSDIRGKDVPIVLTSGYRCHALNRLVSKNPTSDHLYALAADWRAPAFGTPYMLCKALVSALDRLAIGQLIHEYGSWVHTSTRKPVKAMNRVITISDAGTEVGIQKVAGT